MLLRLQDIENFRGGGDGFPSLVWTPDGHYILFRKGTDDQPLEELWRIPVKGGKPQKLLEMEDIKSISIHPDGRRIAFTVRKWTDQVWALENFLPGLGGMQ